MSALIVLLAVPTHVIGLLAPLIYRDPAVLLPQNRGTDLVTLAIPIPLLAVTALAVQRGSARSRPLWLGALGYLVYAYGMYAMAVRRSQVPYGRIQETTHFLVVGLREVLVPVADRRKRLGVE